MTLRFFSILPALFMAVVGCGRGLNPSSGGGAGDGGEGGINQPLSVTRISPAAGGRGTIVTISGSGFTEATQISLGSLSCRSIRLVSASEVICTVPALAPVAHDVTVAREDGNTDVLPGAFTYQSAVYVTHNSQATRSFSYSRESGLLSELATQNFPTQVGTVVLLPWREFIYVAGISDLVVAPIEPIVGTLGAFSNALASVDVRTCAADPEGDFIFAARITSKATVYEVASTGQLTEVSNVDLNSSARGLFAHPNGRWLYAVSNNSDVITHLAFDRAARQLSALDSITTGSDPSDLIFHPNGRLAYGTNSTDRTISTFAINDTTGDLSEIGSRLDIGMAPERFVITSDGSRAYLALRGQAGVGQGIQQFAIDESGEISFVDSYGLADGVLALAIDPENRFLFGMNVNTTPLLSYSIAGNGDLGLLDSSINLLSSPKAIHFR